VRRFAVACAFALAPAFAACERAGVLSVDPEDAPGQASPTLEALVGSEQALSWVDSVFSGYTGPPNASFLQVEEGFGPLASRALIRFAFIDDTVLVGGAPSAVQRFDSARVILGLDTLRSRLATGGTTIQVRLVEQAWDEGSANWENAVDSAGSVVAWTGGPGGSLGAVLGAATLTAAVDSVIIDLGAVSDSLLRAWSDTAQANFGLAAVVGDSGGLVLQAPQLRYNVIPEVNPDTALGIRVSATNSTFIFDPPAPSEVAGVLRLGGVSGWRIFLDLTLPDSLPVFGSSAKALLRGATVQRAELVLVGLEPPAAPFAADQDFTGLVFELADDFTVLGAKTPIGNLLASSVFTVRPDSLQQGSTLAINITPEIQAWANVSPDSTPPPVRLMVRAFPEATTFGFWEFGAADGDPGFVPYLRIVFTRPTEFEFP
jgi:hypothetical protein